MDAVLRRLIKRRVIRFGLPFILLVVGGSFGLKEFTSLRYTFRKQQSITPEQAEKLGIKMKKPGEVTLESEFEKVKKEVDINHWENIRGPRPWEKEA